MTEGATAPPPLRGLAERALERLKPKASGADIELYVSRVTDRGIELREGQLETLQESVEEGVGLRVIRDGRAGFAFCVGLDLDEVERAFDRVLDQLTFLPPDPDKVLPAPQAAAGDAVLASLLEPGLLDAPAQARIDALKTLEADTLKADGKVKRVLRGGYGESRGSVAIASTRGVMAYEEATSCGVSVSAVAEQDAEVQIGSASSAGRRYADLDFARVAREAAYRTVVQLGAKKLPTARRAVVFDPWVSAEVLELIAGMLSADAVQRGRSLLAGKLGRSVGSALATFIDDPRRPGGLASSLFDAEGVPTRRKTSIEAGVVREYFYDASTAAKEGRASNGSAGRGSYKGVPSPGSSNFYLQPGAMTRDALIRDTADGILVLELMGLHTADPVSGEFSVGLSGVEIKDGRLGAGVRGAMVSGNLLDLLSRLDAVGDDLVFYAGSASPTFRVADLTVA
ncbi:MAG: TldD/PmbA family protein [Elusimicrobia bacterium]|nr:TldD/PmbA family protein [Elusimicrobiota bacterium]